MILVKTEAGQQSFKDRSVRLSPRQRSAFILCDGVRSVGEVLSAGMGTTQEDLDQMVSLGMLASSGGATSSGTVASVTTHAPATDAGTAAAAPVSVASDAPAASAPVADATTTFSAADVRTPQQRYKDAYLVATRLTGGLGLRGFRLNLSVEGTSCYEDLVALAPKIRAAVGAEKAVELDRALDS